MTFKRESLNNTSIGSYVEEKKTVDIAQIIPCDTIVRKRY